MDNKTQRFISDLISTLAVCGFIVFMDQLLKSWAYNYLYVEMKGSMPFIKGLIGFEYAENTGAAWSILKDAPWVFISLSVIVVAALFVYILSGRCNNMLLRSSLLMLIGGGAGNLVDRLLRTGSHLGNRNGFVVDMLKFEFIDFPIFNAADIFVCIGAGLLILYMIIFEFRSESKNKNV